MIAPMLPRIGQLQDRSNFEDQMSAMIPVLLVAREDHEIPVPTFSLDLHSLLYDSVVICQLAFPSVPEMCLLRVLPVFLFWHLCYPNA